MERSFAPTHLTKNIESEQLCPEASIEYIKAYINNMIEFYGDELTKPIAMRSIVIHYRGSVNPHIVDQTYENILNEK